MRARFLLVPIGLGTALIGCGGTGLVNPFAGGFSNEPWNQASPSDNGTITFNVSGIGTVSGQLVDTGGAKTYNLSGLIDGGGNFTATMSPVGGGPSSTLGGVLSLSGNQLVGTLTDTGGPLNSISVN